MLSHQAQTCYCGEPNCVGYIGGKTQTDVAVIDDVYLEALGITDADELMELKGSKKKKGKKIDDPDFMVRISTPVSPMSILIVTAAQDEAHQARGGAEGRAGVAAGAECEGVIQDPPAAEGAFLSSSHHNPFSFHSI